MNTSSIKTYVVAPNYCHCSCFPEPLDCSLANHGCLSLGCSVCIYFALIPVVEKRLQGAMDNSSLAGSNTTQEGLQEAGSEVYLRGAKR